MLKEYRNSPTGKVYVGAAKEPLMPDKHGFKGVVVQDEARMLVLCAECGRWLSQIQAGHLKACSGLTVEEYKKEHGLGVQTRLTADDTRNLNAIASAKNRPKSYAKNLSKRDLKKATEAAKAYKNTLEYQNSKGTCPEQIRSRLKEFILTKQRLPNMKNGGSALIGLLKRRHGSIRDGLLYYGLPTRKSLGSTIEYTFGDGSTFFHDTHSPGSGDTFFNLMLEKSNLFKPTE